MMGWYDGDHMGGFGPVMWMFMLVFWVALIALIVFLVVKLLPAGSGPRSTQSSGAVRETPEQILDRMFATGEIDEETYRSRRSALSEMRGEGQTREPR
jgi:putative membrane protein